MSKTPEPNYENEDINLRYIKAELKYIDILLQKQVRLWELAGQNREDAFRGLYISGEEVQDILEQPFGGNWGHKNKLNEQDVEYFLKAEKEAREEVQHISQLAENRDVIIRPIYLADIFGLERFELSTLFLCLAPAVDLRYEKIFGFLQNDVTRKIPGVNLVLDLLAGNSVDRLEMLSYFTENSTLFRFRILERLTEADHSKNSILSRGIAVDETVLAWLLGRYQPNTTLREYVHLHFVDEYPEELKVYHKSKTWAQLVETVQQQPLLVFYGPDKVGKRSTVHFLAHEINRPLLEVDFSRAIETGLSPMEIIMYVLRDALLVGAIPFFDGWEACLDDGELSPEIQLTLYSYPDTMILASESLWLATGTHRDRRLYKMAFPIPGYTQRSALWSYYLGEAPDGNQSILVSLAGQFALTSGQIQDSVATAKDIATQEGRRIESKDLFAAARAHSNPKLSNLAQKISPRYEWSDIILPGDQMQILREIINAVRSRPIVLEQWGIGKKLVSSSGITVLFAGPPGTGKTMAAEIIASELGLDLFKIELSSIVSKYIGETEKNLDRIFEEAQSSNAILFFDEADAIFGKRSEVKDAHDRYANIEVSYLLQRMEAYDGVTILATNLRTNLDEAFTRRLQFAVDFPFPEFEDRLRIWQSLFPSDAPHSNELNFELLATRFKLAGGNIRNVIVNAAYLAATNGGEITMEHLLHSTRRELQKMGRLINEQDLEFTD